MRISDWSSDVCSSDLKQRAGGDGLLRCLHSALPRRSAIPRTHRAMDRARRTRAYRRAHRRRRAGPRGAARALPLFAELFARSEEHTSEIQSLMRISYAVFCLEKKNLL